MSNNPPLERFVRENRVLITKSNLTVTTALHFLTLAVSEVRKDGVVTDYLGRPRTSGVPIVVIEDPSLVLSKLGPSNYVLGETEVHLPLTIDFDERFSFGVTNDNEMPILSLHSPEEPIVIPIPPRFARFAKLTQTLGLMIAHAEPDTFTIVSVRQDGSVVARPNVADSFALVSDKHFDETLESPKAWKTKFVANPAIYIGEVNNSFTYERFFISKSETRVSKALVLEVCLLCGATADITREHCTPQWLMAVMDLEPIVELLLCASCNGELGSRLEAPMKTAFSAGTFLKEMETTKMWALKTAITLAASQNIHVPRVLADAVRSGDVGLGGAEVVVLEQERPNQSPEFGFVVSSLRTEDRIHERFALLFECLGYSFLVVRWEQEISLETVVADISTTRRADVDKYGTMHVLLERLSGESLTAKMPGETWLEGSFIWALPCVVSMEPKRAASAAVA